MKYLSITSTHRKIVFNIILKEVFYELALLATFNVNNQNSKVNKLYLTCTKLIEVLELVKKRNFLILSKCIVNDVRNSIINEINLEDNNRFVSRVGESINKKFDSRALYLMFLYNNLQKKKSVIKIIKKLIMKY